MASVVMVAHCTGLHLSEGLVLVLLQVESCLCVYYSVSSRRSEAGARALADGRQQRQGCNVDGTFCVKSSVGRGVERKVPPL